MHHQKNNRRVWLVVFTAMLCPPGEVFAWQQAPHEPVTRLSNKLPGLRAALLTADQLTVERLSQLHSDAMNAVVIHLGDGSDASREADRRAAERVLQSEFKLYYWIEVARCPQLADAHPQWMASLQGHGEWRRFFPEAPKPTDDEVIKTYPWVPVMAKEPFEAQRQRVQALLENLPKSTGVFLNDLQGAPSACGCGNTLCRWTSDYGKKRVSTPLDENAAANFVKAVKVMVPEAKVIPVWTTECAEHDGAKDGPCAGVGCFEGICWKAYTAQLEPLAKECPELGVLLPVKMFQREQPGADSGGWIDLAVKSFTEMPLKNKRTPVVPARLIAVLQGWDQTSAEIELQVQTARATGAGGIVIAYTKIEQSWEPKLLQWR